MRRLFRCVPVTALVFSLCVSVGGAEPHVATVDLKRVFHDDQTLSREMAAVRADAEAFEQALRLRVEELRELAEKCKQATPHSEEQSLLITEIKEKQAAAVKDAADAKTQFLDREAKIYLAAFKRCQPIIAQCAKEKDILVVVRSGAAAPQADPTTPENVQQFINTPLLYVSDDQVEDLTDEVIRRMNDTAVAMSGDLNDSSGPESHD